MTRTNAHNVRFDSGYQHRSVALGYDSGDGPFNARRRRSTSQMKAVDTGAINVGRRASTRRSDFTATQTF